MQSQSEGGEGIQEEIHVREAYSVTETMSTMGRVRGSRDSREDFEERIEEIDRDLKKFDNDELSKPDTDMVRILGEAISNKHAKKLDFDQNREAVKELCYRHHLGSFSDKKLIGQPRVNAADLVSVPITQTILGDITNILGRLDKTTTVECKKRRKNVLKASTNEHISPSALTRVKRTCDEDGSGLPSKKRVVSLYDQATLSSMVESVK